MTFNIGRWRTTVEIALWRQGWALPLAAACLVSAGLGYLTFVKPSRELLVTAKFELGREQERLAVPAHVKPMDRDLNNPERLGALQATLRPYADAGELVRKMASLAQAQQINLSQSDYQLQGSSTIGVSRVQITQPVRASYPQLRRYIEHVLQAVPNASLDQVTIGRDNVTQSHVEARLKWSLWLHQPPIHAAEASASSERTP
jgi:hypothetical protein